MTVQPNVGGTNRNGHLGDFEAYRPVRVTMDDIMAKLRAGKGSVQAPPVKESRDLLDVDGYTLVRYRLNSPEMMKALDAVGGSEHYIASEMQGFTAAFGIVAPDGSPCAYLDVIGERREKGPLISFIFMDGARPVPQSVMLAALRELDVPPSWRAGADGRIRQAFDLAWNKDAGNWEVVEPVHLVRVGYHRICFATAPTLEEKLDVLLLPVPGNDIADPDEDKAYLARDYYRSAGFEELHRLVRETRPRPGFSSWMPDGDPVLVKVIGPGLDAEIERLAQPDEPEESSGPRF